MAKRAVTVAAAGSHHLLMIGSPGTGKTLLAQRLATILPDLTPEESIETTRIYSAVGDWPRASRCMLCAPRSAPRITQSAKPAWSAAAALRHPAKSASPITACLFLDELPGIQSPHARSAAPTAGGKPRHHLARDGRASPFPPV